MPGKNLDPQKIAATAAQLSSRIAERFPRAGLYALSQELIELGEKARLGASLVGRPIYSVRVGVGVLIALIVATLGSAIWVGFEQLDEIGNPSLVEIVAALEAGTNELVLIGLAVFFLMSVETRIKRARAIEAVHELRSMAHVIDMHQLNKDPDFYRSYTRATKSSPHRELSLPELIRYLEYCSELLSLASKIAALYVQRFNDSVVLEAVSDVETLCAGLSAKIWQKVQIAEAIVAERRESLA
jgi:hypothetical protein